MSNRIKNADLQYMVDRLNVLTGHEKAPWDQETRKANIGTYYIDGAYGGVKLVQIASDTGGVRTISHDGYGTKRELYTFLQGMLSGLGA